MKTAKSKKLVYFLSAAFVLAGFLFTNVAKADNDNRPEVRQAGSSIDVHITNSGIATISGAKVTAVSGNVIDATTSWGSLSLSWEATVNSGVRLTRRFGGTGVLSEIKVGDIVSFRGTIASTTGSPIKVTATSIKDWSIQKTSVKTTVVGTIKSINGTTSMVVTVGGRDYTVNIAGDTSVLNNAWVRASLSSFKAGDHIRVYGVVDATNLTINATVVRDTSLI